MVKFIYLSDPNDIKMEERKDTPRLNEGRDGIKSLKALILDLIGWGDGAQGWGQVGVSTSFILFIRHIGFLNPPCWILESAI